MRILLQFLAIGVFVFAADFIWLGVIMKGFYHHELRGLLRQGPQGFAPRLLPALLVYILIPAGVILFVGPRIVTANSLLHALAWGALFGFIVYGIYDLTNLATLGQWTLPITIVDMLWGCVLCAGSAVCMTLVNRALG
ncbi:MAG TPA: DUF2177 family protein [Planctomycetaceae bacterium]|nr:DUF2177 family protein [Planctomycetaceae bacterium]